MLIFIARLLFMTAVWLVATGKTPLPYKSEVKQCNNATSEYYVKGLGMCCSKCNPGTRMVKKCTSDLDTICEPCQDGLYLDDFNYFSNCFKCPSCKEEKGLLYGTHCSADTRAVCVCKPGTFCWKQDFYSACQECREYKSCKPGEGAESKGSPTSDVKCAPCPSGTFTNRSGAEPCKPHTQCEGAVLTAGSSTADTVCKMILLTTTTTMVHIQTSFKPKPSEVLGRTEKIRIMNVITTSSVSLLSSETSNVSEIRTTENPQLPLIITSCSIGAVVLILLILVMTAVTCKLRNRKGLTKVPIADDKKVEQDPSLNDAPDYQHLLPVDRNQNEPSMSSSDSQSQPDSSQSHSSGEWLERSSQDECPSISSPVVNLSITATINCQLNPGTASCSIPINPAALTPHVEAPVPLSQEEVCISCQQEDGKEALQSVQESGPFVY